MIKKKNKENLMLRIGMYGMIIAFLYIPFKILVGLPSNGLKDLELTMSIIMISIVLMVIGFIIESQK